MKMVMHGGVDDESVETVVRRVKAEALALLGVEIADYSPCAARSMV